MLNPQIDIKHITQHLESQRQHLVEQIQNYPPPIPACDAQFNHLLEQRDLLTIAINQWRKLSRDYSQAENMKQFILQSPFISETIQHEIQEKYDPTDL